MYTIIFSSTALGGHIGLAVACARSKCLAMICGFFWSQTFCSCFIPISSLMSFLP